MTTTIIHTRPRRANINAQIITADCMDWMRTQPEKSVDLVFCSPPYEDARLYDELGFKLIGDAWVQWAADRFVECCRLSRGLVAWVVAGRTRQYRWSATPALLMAELHRRGINLRNPCIYERDGIPGSGGPDWLKSRYEWVVCATPKGRLPWAEPTTMGWEPKYPPGGPPSHQTRDGRVKGATYKPPGRSNPGNVIRFHLQLAHLVDILIDYGIATATPPQEVLRTLREVHQAARVREWLHGVVLQLRASQILQPAVFSHCSAQAGSAGAMPDMPDSDQQGSVRVAGAVQEAEVLLSQVSRSDNGKPRRPDTRRTAAPRTEGGTPGQASEGVRAVRNVEAPGDTPSRRRRDEQRACQPASSLPSMPSGGPQDARMQGEQLWLSPLCARLLQQTLLQVQEVWGSIVEAGQLPRGANEGIDVVRMPSGGGHMGDPLANLNDAPFPEKLAEHFIRPFCPPGGTVLDIFGGSGTTAKVALMHGRRAISVDLRASQSALTANRLRAWINKQKQEQAA